MASRSLGGARWGSRLSATTTTTTSTTTTTTTSPDQRLNNNSNSNSNSNTNNDSDNTATHSSSLSESSSRIKTRDVLSLDSIRNSLIRQEETIIFALIERAQFRHNPIVYQKGGFENLGVPLGFCDPSTSVTSSDATVEFPNAKNQDNQDELSFLEYMLIGTEALHCGVRRYTSPEEHAFFPEHLPKHPLKALPQLEYPSDLISTKGDAHLINFNPLLLNYYLREIVPNLCDAGDDEQHGSTVLCDIAALQALSRRIHYGKFVAESKYQSDPEAYQALVDANNATAVMQLLTNREVEDKVVLRACLKAATYGREPMVLSNLLSPDILNRHDGSDSVASSSMESPPQADLDLNTLIAATAAASAVMAAMDALQSEPSLERKHQHRTDDTRLHNSKSISSPQHRPKVDPRVIARVYRNIIIPLTKDVEVAYLFRRCGREPPPEFSVWHRLQQEL